MAAMTEMLASTEKSHVVQLTDEQRLDWLRLIRSDHVGPRTFRALINHLGGARAALAGLPDLARRGGLRGPPRILSREDAAREIAAARSLGVRFVATGEPDYPPRLKMIDDAPPLLAVRGNAAALALPMVAIVGARNASAAGLRFAERLARDLAGAGFAIVSGLARGIDAAAHRGSLATGTVAVLAGGHDKIYPPEHASLAAGIVIVEAAKRSGSLITARFALEQGREVFAVPGSPLDPRAEGSNGLIKQGATVVTAAADVISVLRPILGQPIALAAEEPDPPAPSAAEPGADERARIVDLLGPTPVPID